jgi:predicted CoA-binding protein
MKKTVIIGSNRSAWKYPQQAALMLQDAELDFVPIGVVSGAVLGKEILNIYDSPSVDNVHTITLYINPTKQKQWFDYMLSLKPKRIIFNPGTENQEFKNLAESKGVECLNACTLVMLSIGDF